jgi:hypothetical protein
MITSEKTRLGTHTIIPKEVKPINETDKTYLMENFSGIVFVKNKMCKSQSKKAELKIS